MKFLFCLIGLLFVDNVKALSTTNKSSTSTITLRICQGSSCMSKCRGAFNPKSSLAKKVQEDYEQEEQNVQIEEAFCMNQCKRGPNMRVIQDGQVITFTTNETDNNNEEDATAGNGRIIMTETEISRKSFQNVRNDDRVDYVWGIVKGLKDDDNYVVANKSGSIKLLSDLMPQKS